MTTFSLTIREDHLKELKNHLLRPDGCEHAAYLLCNKADIRRDPWDREAHQKFIVAQVAPVPDDHVVESTSNIVTWTTTSFVRILKEADANDQVVAIVHNHPSGMPHFSEQDNINEPDLVQLAVNRNGGGTKLLSVILTADGNLSGRVWLYP